MLKCDKIQQEILQMPTIDEKPMIPSRYFKALSQEILKKMDAKEYRFDSLPEEIKTMISDDFKKFDSFQSAQQLEFVSAVSNLQELPNDIQKRVSGFSGLEAIEKNLFEEILNYVPSQGNVVLSNKGLYARTQPQRLISVFLWSVASGNQKKAQEMLKKYPGLLLERGTVTDYSGRTFKRITGFEYALWALDVRYMCPMMLDCLPQNEEGEKIRSGLLKQYEHLEQEGLTYTFDGNTRSNEKHYDISPLTSALKTYVDNYQAWLFPQRKAHWRTVVRGEQFKTVAHVAQHYCEPEVPFNPLPSFKAKTFYRSLNFYSYNTFKTEQWYCHGAGLSDARTLESNLGVRKDKAEGCKGMANSTDQVVAKQSCEADLMALTTLWKIRIEEDLPLLKLRLQNPIQKPVFSSCTLV